MVNEKVRPVRGLEVWPMKGVANERWPMRGVVNV